MQGTQAYTSNKSKLTTATHTFNSLCKILGPKMVARFRSVIRLPVSCRERVHRVVRTVVQCCETEVDRLNLKCIPPPPSTKF